MKKIIISGEIGWDVMPFMIKDELNDVIGDLEVDLSSPGGSVFEGIEIFNLFRDYKRENPDSQMILNIKGIAASMGSYLAANEIFDLVTVEDNATHMIHNPIMGVYGDYQDMKKGADFLEGLAEMIAPTYSNRSGQTIQQIRESMDNETWLFGKEIVEAGFADELIKTDNKTSRSSAVANSELKLKAVMKKVKEKEITENEIEIAAAILNKYKINLKNEKEDNKNKLDSNKPAKGGKNNQEVVIMNYDELKKDYPEIHAKAIKVGEDKGIEKVKANNKALINFKNQKEFEGIEAVHKRIDEAIENSENIDDVKIAVMAILSKNSVQASIESPGDISNGNDISVSGEQELSEEDEGF